MAKNDKNTKIKTSNKINPDEKQVEYWRERAEREFLAGEKEALQVAKDLKTNYNRAIKEIETQINAFYGKYASENEMSLEEAKILLNKGEKKDFKSLIKDMLIMGKKEDFTEKQLNDYKRLYTKARITRLDELETNIKFEIDKLTNSNKEQIEDLLKNTYESQYYQSVFDVEQFRGYSSSFSGLDSTAVTKAINTKWLGSNYTISLYKNEQNLLTTLNQEIPRGLTLGYNPRKLAGQVSQRLNTNYNANVRLIRTEYNKIQNDASINGYKAAGVEYYQLLATLDSRTSDICRALNGEIKKVAEAETGVNFPPFHPNCRTTTIAYFPPDEFDLMTDEELANYIDELDTKEWLKGLVEQKNGKLQYENESNILNTREDVANSMKSILNVKQIDLGRMPVDIAKQYLNGIKLFIKEYPEMKGFITNIDTKVGKYLGLFNSGNAYYTRENITKIGNFPTISLKSPSDISKFNITIDVGIKNNYFYKGYSTKSITAHELTHALEEFIYRKENNYNGFDKINGRKLSSGVAREIILQARQELYGEYAGKKSYEGSKYLGSYAMTNFSEQLAQAISYELTVGTQPYSAKVKELLDKKLKGVISK